MILLVVQKTTITASKTTISHKNIKIYLVPSSTGVVDYEKILSKMEYKIVKKNLLRTRSLNTPKSHYHTNDIYPKGEQKYKLFFAETINIFVSLFLFHRLSFFFFSGARGPSNSLCRTQNQKEKEPQFTLCGACFVSVSVFSHPHNWLNRTTYIYRDLKSVNTNQISWLEKSNSKTNMESKTNGAPHELMGDESPNVNNIKLIL